MNPRFPEPSDEAHGSDVQLQLQLDLLDECDRMKSELAAWLIRTREQFAPRVGFQRRGTHAQAVLPISLSRALIILFCTSPGVRKEFSADARNGLLAALDSMEDSVAGPMINTLLGEKGMGQTTQGPL